MTEKTKIINCKINEYVKQELRKNKMKVYGRIKFTSNLIRPNFISRKYVFGDTEYDCVIKKSAENNLYYFYMFCTNTNSTDRFIKCAFTVLTKGKYCNNQKYSSCKVIPEENKFGWGYCLGTDDLSIYYNKNNKKIKINFDYLKEDRLIEFDIKQIKNNSAELESKENKPVKYTIKLLKVNFLVVQSNSNQI